MAPIQDACDFLAGEVLGEMAGNFFGRRKAVEDLIDMVFAMAETLREQASLVDGRAGFLAHLLLEPSAVTRFYATLEISSPQPLMVQGFDERALPPDIPFSLFAAGRFLKVFKWAYAALEKDCDEYMHGPEKPAAPPEEGTGIQPSYNLLVKLAERANDEVDRINREVSPSAVLQSARKLGPIGAHRRRTEDISPGVECAAFDQKFAFSRIDFKSLSLKAYPELPAPGSVGRRIDNFCNRFYKAHRRPVREMLAALSDRITRRSS
jgi:hypothetical protein